jgi:glycosyltransferase involved in cell wall biosynthesis
MKLMFVYWAMEDQGSGLVIQGYTEAARALGHEVSVYGRWIPGKNNPVIPLNYSVDIGAADAVVFIFEWTTRLQPGDQLDLARILSKAPRNRRVVFDGDGKYNHVITAGDDYNHANDSEARQWMETCDSISDKICQPTLRPLLPGVIPFLFYAYNRSWERPLHNSANKDFDMIYVGHSKFRWSPMMRVLKGVEPVRSELGRIGLLGYGWDSPPHWASSMQLKHAYFADSGMLEQLGVEFLSPVRFEYVIEAMSRAKFNPILLRSLFSRLSIVTPRIFETVAAGTIPLLVLEPEYVRKIYGESALELILPEEAPEEKILDMVNRPERYRELVMSIRAHLAEHHSHTARLRRLIEIIES